MKNSTRLPAPRPTRRHQLVSPIPPRAHWRLQAVALVLLATNMVACTDDFTTAPPFTTQIEQVGAWPSVLGVGDTVELQIALAAGIGTLAGPRATWESSNPGALRVEPLPISGDPDSDSLVARRLRVRAIATRTGSATITVSVASASGYAGTTRTFVFEVELLWQEVVGFINHTCGRTAKGYVYCWGALIGSEAVTNSPAPRLVEVPAAGALRFRSLVAGQNHVCGEVLLAQPYWFCWGLNFWNQLANGTTVDAFYPVPMNTQGLTFSRLAVSDQLSCGLSSDRPFFISESIPFCWGLSNASLDWIRELPDPAGPTWPDDLLNWWGCDFGAPCPGYYDVSVGNDHACALHLGINAQSVRTEAVICWGDNTHQQLGGTTLASSRTTAAAVGGETTTGTGHVLTAIASTRYASCVLDVGTLYCWGDFFGDNIVDALPGITLTTIASSPDGDEVCGIVASDHRPICVSASTGQQIPMPSVAADGTPLELVTMMVAGRMISGSGGQTADLRHYCGITTTAAMYCWGANYAGQLGQSTQDLFSAAPVRVQDPT